jgi:hypothetical protein
MGICSATRLTERLPRQRPMAAQHAVPKNLLFGLHALPNHPLVDDEAETLRNGVPSRCCNGREEAISVCETTAQRLQRQWSTCVFPAWVIDTIADPSRSSDGFRHCNQRAQLQPRLCHLGVRCILCHCPPVRDAKGADVGKNMCLETILKPPAETARRSRAREAPQASCGLRITNRPAPF